VDLSQNPLAVLTFLSAPAVLTNASCVLLFGTGNRYGRAIDRVHELVEQIRARAGDKDLEQRLRIAQLRAGERRAALIVRALSCFYGAVASFTASTLVCLIGTVLRGAGSERSFGAFVGAALGIGTVGMLSILGGALMLVRESWFSFAILREERAWLERVVPSPEMTVNGRGDAVKTESSRSGSQISAEDTLVLLLDLQTGIVELTQTHPLDRLRRAVGALGKLARLFELPVIVSAVREQNRDAVMLPEIEAAIGAYSVHYRTTCDVFQNEGVMELIRATGRRTLLIAGVATELAVQLPALAASDAGYRAFVVVDACGGMSARTEQAALERIHGAGGRSISVMTLAGEMAGDLRERRGQEAVGILFEMAQG
jgi:nicotinamidase-related amidase